MAQTWRDIVTEKTRRQQASIPKEWILTNLPPKEQLNVISFPETCGLLSVKEIEITNTNVDGLLEKLKSGRWSAVDVTIAFSKRAIVAHQLVSHLKCTIRLSITFARYV
jgi:amidase